MNKLKLYLFLIIISLLAGPDIAFGMRNPTDKGKEKVVLLTDRSLYIAGEKIQFFASLFSPDNVDSSGQSTVLYVELISPDGDKFGEEKHLLINSSVAGCMIIPNDIITGIYYIRAYTKFMRNYGPLSYGYTQIRIINPDRSEVLAGDNSGLTSNVQPTQSEKPDLTDLLSVTVGKPVYTPQDTVNISLRVNSDLKMQIRSLCLSVVPETTPSTLFNFVQPKAPLQTNADYLPETSGISLTGKLTESSSQTPVKGKRINLSIIGKGSDFMAVRTDSSGRFFFALPNYPGSRDIFLCAEKTPATNLKIFVDNDFCALPVHLPSPAFFLSEQERKIAFSMALNRQIDSYFYNDTLPKALDDTNEEHSFYGKPTVILYFDQYVQLPTLEEYFNELPGLVKVRKRNNQKYFKVTGSYNLSYYDPLVLIDWVAVDEPDRLLAVAPQNISRIEIVNELYIKGGQTYGGIISIITKRGDYAGIDLPTTGIFVKYGFLSEYRCTDKIYDSAIYHPDARNTLLWKPGFTLQQGQIEKFVLTAPAKPGRYNVVVEGITPSGEIVETTNIFEVKN